MKYKDFKEQLEKLTLEELIFLKLESLEENKEYLLSSSSLEYCIEQAAKQAVINYYINQKKVPKGDFRKYINVSLENYRKFLNSHVREVRDILSKFDEVEININESGDLDESKT